MPLFKFENKLPTKAEVNKAVGKLQITRKRVDIASVRKVGRKDVNSIVSNIKELYSKHLIKYKEETELVTSPERLAEYINKCNENKIVAIDTETTGLDWWDNNIVGMSLYTSGEKAIYVPIAHISYVTRQPINDNVSKEDCYNALSNLSKDVKVIMWNAKFDLHFIDRGLGVKLNCYWDGLLLQKLNTNGLNVHNGLKPVWKKVCNIDDEVLKFDEYFDGITFDLVPVKYGYIYAAMDAKMTYDVYKYQIETLKKAKTDDNVELLENYEVFKHIEMPLVPVIEDMEGAGITFDTNYANTLSVEYNQKLKEVTNKLDNYLNKHFKLDLENYRKLNPLDNKLSNPINYSSPAQVGIVLYDIMGLSAINGRKTGEEVLQKLNTPFTNMLLEYRGINKLVTTYIEKMPSIVKDDGKIHASFNQLGARTGRFSSDNPNLQNIPAQNKDIRKMFTAGEGKLLFSVDYSAQEPRIAAHLSNDKLMIKAFTEGYDFYSFLGASAYHLDYEQCREFFPGGSPNPEGKKIRDRSKKAYLGLCYGMSTATLAEQMKIEVSEAQEVVNLIFKACKGLKDLLNDSIQMGKELGYITTIWGRKRYLEYIQRDRFEFDFNVKGGTTYFDPLDFDDENDNSYLYEDIKRKWLAKLNRAWGFKGIKKIIEDAAKEGVKIIDNTGYIKEDERRAINSRIQGSAADMTKQGMIEIFNSQLLKDLGFQLLLTVHDEVIGEGLEENKDLIIKELERCMLKPTEGLRVPFKCDVEVSKCWYGETL